MRWWIGKGAEDDLWFHAKDVSSCHVVCEVPDDIKKKKELMYIIKIGALLCKNNTQKLVLLQEYAQPISLSLLDIYWNEWPNYTTRALVIILSRLRL